MIGQRTGRRLADAIAATSGVLLIACVVVLWVLNHAGSQTSPLAVVGELLSSGTVAFVIGFGGVGWLLARRVPGNPIGWCFAVGGLFWALNAVIGGWAELALTGHVELGTFARVCAQLNTFDWIVAMPFSVQLPLLLLPGGRLLSPRWRFAVWLVVGGVVIGSAGFLTKAGPIGDTDPARHLTNPMGVAALGPVPLYVALTGAGMLLAAIAVGAVAVVRRFRRSTGVERQQLRWVALGGCGVLVGPVLALTPGVPGWLNSGGGTLAILAVPVCVGVAVLRYRLYDLGRLVSRTVSYAVVTGLLLTLYLTLVAALSRLLPGSSSYGVVASTLAVAALVQPLRRRVQVVVDRRFNRARYDADHTVQAFAGRLRDEVDLEAVRSDLLGVVQQTLQPDGVALWLRSAAR